MARTLATAARLAAIVGIISILLPPSILKSNDEVPPEKRKVVEDVFNRLKDAFGPTDDMPRLDMLSGANHLPYDRPADGVIFITEGFYDFCALQGRDSLDVLAYALAHEMAHHYLKHGLLGEVVTMKPRGVDRITRKQDSMGEEEWWADIWGGFYSRVAGFNALDVAPLALEGIYDDNSLDPEDDDGRYPDLDERKGIAWNIEEDLTKLFTTYEAANDLTLIKEYVGATTCYDDLLKQFPSREIFNNAGVAYLLRALQSMPPERAGFIYPIELDADSRLRGVQVTYGQIDRDSRAPGDTAIYDSLLDIAQRCFDSAIARQNNYAPTLINQATIAVIRDESKKAKPLINKARRADTSAQMRARAWILEAIMQARNGDEEEALRLLHKASTLEHFQSLVTADSVILFKGYFSNATNEMSSSRRELVHGIAAADTGAMWPPTTIDTVLGANAFRVLSKDRWSCTMIQVRRDATWAEFVTTRPEYDGATRQRIRIGSSEEEVRARYGEPRIVEARQGRYYIYKSSKIIFFIGPDHRVRRWTIYAAN